MHIERSQAKNQMDPQPQLFYTQHVNPVKTSQQGTRIGATLPHQYDVGE
jgi:hypothetical protein